MKTGLKTEREKNNHHGPLHLPHLLYFPLTGILKRLDGKSSAVRAEIFRCQSVYHVPEQVYTMSPVCTAPRAPWSVREPRENQQRWSAKSVGSPAASLIFPSARVKCLATPYGTSIKQIQAHLYLDCGFCRWRDDSARLE
jgi:hypothetical protein